MVDLYAALEIATGNVTHRVTDSHTGADFLAFMKTVVRRYSKQELHVVLDNSSTHATPDVKAWLAANPQVHFHYTPTSASWFNQVEVWLAEMERQVIGCTIFTIVSGSARQHRRYTNAYSANARSEIV